jgi:hypothetical protein
MSAIMERAACNFLCDETACETKRSHTGSYRCTPGTTGIHTQWPYMPWEPLGGTWEDDVRAYDMARNTSLWRPCDTKVTSAIVQRRERQFNPILQTYLDPERDRAFTAEVQARSTQQLARGQARALASSYVPYDIVTQEWRRGATKEPSSRRRNPSPDSRTPYDILTGQRRPSARVRSFGRGGGEAPPRSMRLISHGHEQAHNVVSNLYRTRHEIKARAEREASAGRLRQRERARASQFDAVAGRFVGEAEERAFCKTRDADAASHGTSQTAKLPPGYRRAEGNRYDILNGAPKRAGAGLDTHAAEIESAIAQEEALRAARRAQSLEASEAAIKARNEAKAVRDDLRRRNRRERWARPAPSLLERADAARRRITTAAARGRKGAERTGLQRLKLPATARQRQQRPATHRGRRSRGRETVQL